MGFMTVLFVAAVAPTAAELVRVHPQDTGEALVNPQMGWTMHFYSNYIENYGSKLAPSDTLDDWPGLSAAYLRVPWSFLEPEEGRFNWALLDTPAQRWTDKGKQIALRISCSESWLRWATPEWVHDAGAKGYNFTPGKGVVDDGVFWEPDYNDPVFLEKLDAFLAAMALRYDGNPNVAFVDIGSYGVWGEGHTWASTQLEYDVPTRKRHVDLHLKHFKKTLLCLSDDFAGPEAPGAHHEITDYALSKGVTLRDDSICVQPPPRSYFHADMAALFWPKLPVILEHDHYGASKSRNAWRGGSLVMQAIEEYHASYLSIHWWPRILLDENRELVARINRRLGYRIQLRAAQWPASARIGQPFEVGMTWANAGVAPCYPGGHPALTLKDAEGGIVSVHADESFDVRSLPVGPPEQAGTRSHKLMCTVAPDLHGHRRPVEPGTYDLFVSVGMRDGTPRLALPHEAEDGRRRYRLGRLSLETPPD